MTNPLDDSAEWGVVAQLDGSDIRGERGGWTLVTGWLPWKDKALDFLGQFNDGAPDTPHRLVRRDITVTMPKEEA